MKLIPPAPPAPTLVWEKKSRVIRQVSSSLKALFPENKRLASGNSQDEAVQMVAWASHASSSAEGVLVHSTVQLGKPETVYHLISLPADEPGCIRTLFIQANQPTPEASVGDPARVSALLSELVAWDDAETEHPGAFILGLAEQLLRFFGGTRFTVLSEARRVARGGGDTGLLIRMEPAEKSETTGWPADLPQLAGRLCGDSLLGIGNHSRTAALGGLLGLSVLTETTRFLVVLARDDRAWLPTEQALATASLPVIELVLDRGLARRGITETVTLLENALASMDDSALLLRFVDGQGIITHVNETFLATFGLNRDQVLGQSGRTVIELMRPRLPDPQAVTSLVQLVQETEAEQSLEISLAGENHSVLRVNSAPCRNAEHEVIARILYFHDITRDKEIENQLLHSQKMESIGTLAGGVAHDFNNLLTTMLGNAELLKREVMENESAMAKLAQIEKSGRRAAELTGSLLAFSRRNPTIFRVVRLNDLIEETLSILRSSIPATIEIKIKPDANLPYVEADPTQIEQVLINLALNARDAVPSNGKIVLATYASRDPQSLHDPEAPMYAVLEVADNGMGIPQENLHRVFEPFYTTKEVGKGTGLGLAMVYGIVKKHGGFIEVKSAPGMGSRFSVFIPTTKKQPTPYQAGGPPEQTLLGRTNYSFLIVDDEPDLREFCIAALGDFCGRIVTAENGIEALRLFERDPHAFDLVLLDLTMPRMNGADCYRRMSEINPAVRVLISSGYSLDEGGKSLITHGPVGFLPKPYSVDQLIKAVSVALKSTPNVKRSGPKTPQRIAVKPTVSTGDENSMIVGSPK